jgi:hypothetical protein
MDVELLNLWKAFFALLMAYDKIPAEKRTEQYTDTILNVLTTIDINHTSENLRDYSTFCKTIKPMLDNSFYVNRFNREYWNTIPTIPAQKTNNDKDVILGPGSEFDYAKT